MKKWTKLTMGFAVVVMAFVMYGAVAGSNLAAATCTNNDIIRCGVTSQSQLADGYNKGDVGAIFNHYGISSSMIATQNAVVGSVTKGGDVVYNGQVIATGAQSIGREWANGSTAVKIGSTTVYQRSTSAIFKQDSLEAYIYRDSAGRFLAAVLTSCGNPVVAAPVPKPVEKVWVCDTNTGKATYVDKATVTDTSMIVNSEADCKIAQVKVCDTTTSPWSIKMVDKDKVLAGQKIITNDSECVQPVKKVLVCDVATGTVTEVDGTKVPVGSKVVAKAEDCKKTEYVWVCDTTKWIATKVDKTKVTSGQKVVATAEMCGQVWVCNETTGAATQVPRYDLPSGAKVVASAADCKKPAKWVLVCDTKTWTVTKIDETTVKDGQKVVTSEAQCVKPMIEVCDTAEWKAMKMKQSDYLKDTARYRKMTEVITCTKPVAPAQCVVTCQPKVEVNQTQSQQTVVYQSTAAQKVVEQPVATTQPTQVVELPRTGPVEAISSGVGLASVSGAGYAYIMSRRRL